MTPDTPPEPANPDTADRLRALEARLAITQDLLALTVALLGQMAPAQGTALPRLARSLIDTRLTDAARDAPHQSPAGIEDTRRSLEDATRDLRRMLGHANTPKDPDRRGGV